MVKRIFKLAVGILMLSSVLVGYLPEPELMVELTCISNALGGLLLIFDNMANTDNKPFVSTAYRNVCVCIFTVFMVCMASLTGSQSFNFSGAFFFLHVTNPLLFIGIYIICRNNEKMALKSILTAPVLMMVYLLLDLIYGQFSGKFVYGFVETKALSIFTAVIIGATAYILMCLIASILLWANTMVNKKRK